MARSPYKHAKRQKELAKKKKQEEKRQRKLEKKAQQEAEPTGNGVEHDDETDSDMEKDGE